MIIVTGAAGFIGSNIIAGLNARGITDILAVDDLEQGDKFLNLRDLQFADYADKDDFRRLLNARRLSEISAVFHEGACSDTTERNGKFMMDNNYQVSLELLDFCTEMRVPFIYASSAAVYGALDTFREDVAFEAPLNVYGYSKFFFDQVVRRRMDSFRSQVVGLRYFNVYGPREQHKGRMSSVAFHNFNQFLKEGHVRLFGGYDGYGPGEQTRDFIFVDDVVNVNLHFLDHPNICGIFNCGTGRGQSFNDVAQTVVNTIREYQGKPSLTLEEQVDKGLLRYIEFPDDLKGKYQSFTQANLGQLKDEGGYKTTFTNVQDGVAQYVRRLLQDLPPKKSDPESALTRFRPVDKTEQK